MPRAIAAVLFAATSTLVVAWLAGGSGTTIAGLPALVACAGAALCIQWIAGAIAIVLRTERFYDLVGSLTYLVVVGLALTSATATPRIAIVAALVVVWAVRLGSYLAIRGARHGDRRFDEIKRSPPRFLVAWTLQGVWVMITALAALVAIVTPEQPARVLATDVLGVALWALGFGLEVVADGQKAAFRRNPANAGRFVTTGLWSISRHPNYLGEIVLWIGVFVVAAGVVSGPGFLAVLSPLFVVVLLTRVSGIPLLEASAEKRWGEDPNYREYRDRTPTLIPRWRR